MPDVKCPWSAFIQRVSNRSPLKALYNSASQSPIHAHTHTPTAVTTVPDLSGAVRMRCPTQRHLATQPGGGGAGDGTRNLPVTGQPARPPEPHAAHRSHHSHIIKLVKFHTQAMGG